ncbi:MAG: sulfite exporter TauE/SafE family protein [Myxococcota bacterium]
MLVLLACAAAFLAGFVDAVAGGGGLVQLPALLVLYPEAAVPTMLGTNKVASVAGTAAALWKYAGSVAIPWRAAGPAAVAAFVGSFGGARLATQLPTEWLRPVVVVLLAAVLAYTLAKKDFGQPAAPRIGPAGAAAMGAGLGIYDGFFGPGTGSFLLFGFVALCGLDFLGASASAKLVNVATNLAAIVAFAAAGVIRWELALPMAVCNVAGSQIGTRLALAKGAGFVRSVFVVVVTGMLMKLGWGLIHG